MHKVFFLSLSFILLSSCSYLPEEEVISLNLREENGDYAVYYSSETPPGKAFLFVPGGLLDPYVYACWIDRLATANPDIAIVLLKFPSNLAISHMSKVMKVADKLTQFDQWVVGGHSLGGVVASTVVKKNDDFFDGLVMLASWSRKSTDLNAWQGLVLSIYASEDLLATPKEVDDNRQFLPPGSQVAPPFSFDKEKNHCYYYLVDGGNHSGFGCYGLQDGDGEALISAREQQDALVAALGVYFESLW